MGKRICLLVLCAAAIAGLAGCFGGTETEDIVFTRYESTLEGNAFAGALLASNDSLSNGYVISSQQLDEPTTVTMDYTISADGGNLYILYVTPRNNERRLAMLENCSEGSSAQGQVIISMPTGESTIGVVGQKALNCTVEVTLSSEPTPTSEESRRKY